MLCLHADSAVCEAPRSVREEGTAVPLLLWCAHIWPDLLSFSCCLPFWYPALSCQEVTEDEVLDASCLLDVLRMYRWQISSFEEQVSTPDSRLSLESPFS